MKIAVVTGGTKGIGRQIVKDLLRRQYRVYTNYSSDEDSAQAAALEFTAISPHFQIVKADQADNEAFLEFIQLIKSQENKCTMHCWKCWYDHSKNSNGVYKC